MVSVKSGDEFNLDVYDVKEIYLEEVTGKDGEVTHVPSIRKKTIVNPDPKYLGQRHVKIENVRKIKIQIVEVNEVGGRVGSKFYLIGMRIIENNNKTHIFHIMVKDDDDFKKKVIKEIDFYLRTRKQLS